MRRLGCLRGIGTLTGFALAVEIGDWHRFTGNSIGSFVGLVPAEYSSGSSRSQGPITKTGNGHARRGRLIITELLTRLGIGELVLIDDDDGVDPTNLPRLLGHRRGHRRAQGKGRGSQRPPSQPCIRLTVIPERIEAITARQALTTCVEDVPAPSVIPLNSIAVTGRTRHRLVPLPGTRTALPRGSAVTRLPFRRAPVHRSWRSSPEARRSVLWRRAH